MKILLGTWMLISKALCHDERLCAAAGVCALARILSRWECAPGLEPKTKTQTDSLWVSLVDVATKSILFWVWVYVEEDRPTCQEEGA